ncbi:hypothetical protein RSAG8_09496, partial [Rhizoctonia solani AG-8 WAC10335]
TGPRAREERGIYKPAIVRLDAYSPHSLSLSTSNPIYPSLGLFVCRFLVIGYPLITTVYPRLFGRYPLILHTFNKSEFRLSVAGPA